VRHVGGDAGVGQQIGEPAQVDGGLEGDLDRFRRQLAEDAQERIRLAGDRALKSSAPSSSRAANCERLQCRSTPMYTMTGLPDHTVDVVSMGSEACSFVAQSTCAAIFSAHCTLNESFESRGCVVPQRW
jgi:hypothetical protein